MDNEEEKKLPHGVALSWGLVEPPKRGPKRELSVKQIVNAAITIADENGLSAVSMNRIASSLGFTPMSLYRYIRSKKDLLILMQDAASQLNFPAFHDPADWRLDMKTFVRLNLDVYTAHPWFLETPIYSVPMTPNSLKVVDWALGTMKDLPLNGPEKMSIVLLLSSYARSCGIIQRDFTLAVRSGENPEAFSGKGYGQTLMKLATAERFPYLHQMVASGVYTDENTDEAGDVGDDFEFGLERILDGIEHYLEEKSEP